MLELFCQAFFVFFADFLEPKDTVALSQTCTGSNQFRIHILKAIWNEHKLETGRRLLSRVLSQSPNHPIWIGKFLELEEGAKLSQTCTLCDYVVRVLWIEHSVPSSRFRPGISLADHAV